MWIESERAGSDFDDVAVRRWIRRHWPAFVRARWLEHLQGKRFWIEMERGDFGLLQRLSPEDALLVDRILDRLAAGQENLDILVWAIDWGISQQRVIEVLELLNCNSRPLAPRLNGDVPFVWIDASWLTCNEGLVVRLAQHIDEKGDGELLPVLGDALEEAGCADPAILGHCRSGGPHPRWSWLVEQILERAFPPLAALP